MHGKSRPVRTWTGRGESGAAALDSLATVDATNRNTALASAFVEELARCGLRHAVLAPGSRSSPLALALWRAPAIAVSVLVDERSAGYFALGAAQAGGIPVAVLCTSGTAAANLHPAVCEADLSAVPLVVLTADRPPELRDIGAGQTIDQLKLYGDAVRWFCEVGTHAADDAGLLHLRATACRAYAAARGEPRPGPVHLNLAWRDPLGPEPRPGEVTAATELALGGRGERPLTAVTGGAPEADEALVAELAERIAVTPRGLILAGRQPDPDLAEPVAALARAAGYPILAEPTSQLRLGPHDRGLVVSAYEPAARARPAALAPELVLRFGEMPTCKPLREWIASRPALRQVAVDARFGWNEPTRMAETIVRAEPAGLARGLTGRLGALTREPGWARAWLDADTAAQEAVAQELAALRRPTEPGAHAALGALYGDGDLVYTASSMPIRDQEAFLPSRAARVRFLANRGANGIDGLISSGLGAATAGGRATWIVTGDLGLFHDMNGLAALTEVASPVRIVVLDNRGGGIFEFLPQAGQIERDEFEALYGTPVEAEPERVAALHGLTHERIEDLDRLGSAAAAERVLIEIPIDRRANVELHGRISEAAIAAVEHTLKPTKEEAR
jgi:2-succinyl-5-enolpyruvyl-6-hydroxy-3-cyclohexene-1-carboxylate synthase